MDVTFRVLVTGFTPFGGDESNPSGDAARELGARGRVTVLGPKGGSLIAKITAEILDVLWSLPQDGNQPAQSGAADKIEALIQELAPDIVIATGMASGDFRVEQRAEDRDAAIFDNAHSKAPQNRREFPAEPQFLPTSLPVKKIQDAWAKAGIRNVKSSMSAGNFICEDVFYRVMRAAKDPARQVKGLRILRAGFIHVPAPGHTSTAKIADALEIAIGETMLDIAPLEYP
jgi:pyroglutamyl-peptidase